jgi:5-methylcytosine-specific restriction endonuclease McrA
MSDSNATTPATKTCTECGKTLSATVANFYRINRSTDDFRSACKKCTDERARLYRIANKDRVQAQRKQYRLLHSKDIRASGAVYRAAYPERMAIYRKAHYGQLVLQTAAYRAAHQEEIAAELRAWKRANPERQVAYERNRRARKSGNGGTHTTEDIQAQYDRQKGKCFYCGKKVGKKYHVDHVVPLAKGGSNGPENLVVSCPWCNQSKKDKHPMDFCGRLL